MAGHSKWNNIKQRKGAQDAKKGKIFQKHSRKIYKAAKDGGSDTEMNSSLRMAIDNAKSDNMPNDNIERAIKRATDPNEGANYDEVTYEGYGPNGVGILVHALTDNTNRTSTNVKICFEKNGGNMGDKGSVSYMFDRKGVIVIEREDLDVDEDTMLMSVLEAGGEELETSDEVFEIYTDGSDFTEVRDELEKEYTISQAELTMIPQTRIPLSDEDMETLDNIIDALEDDDDVSEVYHSAAASNEVFN